MLTINRPSNETFSDLFYDCWKSRENKKSTFVFNANLAKFHLSMVPERKRDLTYGKGVIPKGRLIDLAAATILIFDAVHRIDPEVDFARVIKTKLDSDRRHPR